MKTTRVRAIAQSFGPGAWLVALALMLAGPAAADTKADLLKSYEAMAKAGKFRTVATVESGGTTTKRTALVVWPDRYHMISDEMEMIILPGQTYMKQGTAWQQFPMDMSKMVEGLQAEAVKKGYEGTTNLVDLGAEPINGRAARAYEYDVTATVMGISSKSHVKMWVDAATGLPVRQVIDGEAMGQKSRTVQDYEFDPSIRIEAPL